MKGFSFLKKENMEKLPKDSGVYLFKGRRGFLYIGKAGNIKERVKNHFCQPSYRDNLFLEAIEKIGYKKTGSEIEALLLEAELIKKYRPKFNIMWRDDKNYFWVAVAKNKDKVPYVFITHQPTEVSSSRYYVSGGLNTKYLIPDTKIIGPFVDGTALKKTLRLLRRVFPYYTTKRHPSKPCFWCHLKICPGPNPDLKEYKKNIKSLTAVLEGRKQKVLYSLKKEMKKYSKERDFEKAAVLRDQVFALEKVIANARILGPLKIEQDNWNKTEKLLEELLKTKKPINRIEGYDVSNIQGEMAAASMVVFIKGLPNKNQYRRFKIRGKFTPYRTNGSGAGPNDTAMIKEALSRRLLHNEWQCPDLILVDGGKPQLNAAASSIKYQASSTKTPVIALAKKYNKLFIRGRNKPILLKNLPREIFNLILQIRDEAHRFAIAYHKKLREKGLLNIF